MSKGRLIQLSAMAAALAVSAPLPARAQTAAELATLRDSVQLRYARARAALEVTETQARAIPDDSLVSHGNIVRFNSANLAEGEQKAVRRAFDAAAAELRQLLGPDGPSLLSGQVWLITVSRPARGATPLLGLEALEGERRANTESLRLPLNIPGVVEVIRRQAGRNLVRSQPRVRDWVGGGFRMAEPTQTHYFANRMLALNASSPARRCARGNIPACEDILDPTARARWFDPTDVVNQERVAASGMVRESVLRYAIEVDGPAVLRAFRSSVDTAMQPVPFLAAALGQQPEQFVKGWQSTLAQSGAVRARALPRVVLAALGWFALFGVVATRRRPQ